VLVKQYRSALKAYTIEMPTGELTRLWVGTIEVCIWMPCVLGQVEIRYNCCKEIDISKGHSRCYDYT
jgi:hypothetical protein